MPTCKRGTIRRKAYTRKNGRKVGASCVKNMGAPGRWRTVHRSKGIGPLKAGRLARFGYHCDLSVERRHAALRAASRRLGSLAVFRMLNALVTYTKRTSPSMSGKYLADRNYVRKQLF
jgi:hypothetical protein